MNITQRHRKEEYMTEIFQREYPILRMIDPFSKGCKILKREIMEGSFLAEEPRKLYSSI